MQEWLRRFLCVAAVFVVHAGSWKTTETERGASRLHARSSITPITRRRQPHLVEALHYPATFTFTPSAGGGGDFDPLPPTRSSSGSTAFAQTDHVPVPDTWVAVD